MRVVHGPCSPSEFVSRFILLPLDRSRALSRAHVRVYVRRDTAVRRVNFLPCSDVTTAADVDFYFRSRDTNKHD